jgi:hypothetical protein
MEVKLANHCFSQRDEFPRDEILSVGLSPKGDSGWVKVERRGRRGEQYLEAA